MSPYTVLLLRPDYLAEPYGQDTYLAHVFADSPDDAVEAAQIEVWNVDRGDDAGTPWTDYHPLLVLEGHHRNPDPTWGHTLKEAQQPATRLDDPEDIAAWNTRAALAQQPATGELEPYDAGLLNDFGGGNVEWWQDYIRAELEHAHDFYQSQITTPQPAQATQAEAQQPASKEHLFELWWEAHMPNATQEQAWTAFTAAVASNGVGIAAQQPATGEPVGYMNEGHIHELAMRRLPYGYVYPEAGAGASTAVYAHPAPSVPATPEPVIIGALARRNIFDAIRGAYDLGYNDARNARAVPGDSAPGYEGRNVEADHGEALAHTLARKIGTTHTPEPTPQEVVNAFESARSGSDKPAGILRGVRAVMRLLPDLKPAPALSMAATPEPVAWLSTDSIGERYLCFAKPTNDINAKPLVHPAPSVPEAIEPESWHESSEQKLSEESYCKGWNACRAAMLAAKEKL